MSRKASRAAVAAQRKAIAARRERAKRDAESAPAETVESAPQTKAARRKTARATRTTTAVATKSDPSEARIWNALLIGGTAVAVGLLGRQLADAYADRARPKMIHNDVISAIGSVALLVIICVFAYKRWSDSRA